MFMKSTRIVALVALSLGAMVPLAAQASARVDRSVQVQIKDMLSADGYDVRKIVPENGMIEVYAVKNGQMLEIYLDSNLNIMRIKQR